MTTSSAPAARRPPPRNAALQHQAQAILEQVARVVRGRPEAARLAVIALLAEGHLLIEDVPGVGKTTLAKALAASIEATAGRIQFTPDLMPSDIIGSHVYRADTGDFEFMAGPVFAHLVIGDEINRASPKTQSALLEAMQEAHVTVDGKTYPLPRPFIVVATQNPVEMEGTYALPEAQRDRFMARIAVGYPDLAHEIALLEVQEVADPLDDLKPVISAEDVLGLIRSIRGLYAAGAIKRYIAELARATRQAPSIALGASPRASIQLLRAAKAAAALDGRDHVLPDDVQRLVRSVWAHRLVLTRQTRSQGLTPEAVLDDLLRRVPVR